jgi:hypothetical protein
MLDLRGTHDLMDLKRRGHTFERLAPECVAGKIPLDEALRRRTDEHRIRRRPSLKPCCNVGGLAQGELFLSLTSTHLPHHDEPRVDAHTDRQVDPLLLSQAVIARGQRLHDA